MDCFVSLFAVDIVISVFGKNLVEFTNMPNLKLCILYDRIRQKMKKLNNEKTEGMVIDSNEICRLLLDLNKKLFMIGTDLNFVVEIKYLGVMVNPWLGFNKHINYLCEKLERKDEWVEYVLAFRQGQMC